MENQKKVTYDEILFLIKNELIEVMEDNYNFYKDYEFVIDIEQNFLKNYDISQDNHKIFIVLSFGATAVTHGQIVLPVVFKALSEQNKLDVCQTLLTDFALKFNLKPNDDGTIRQVLETPTVSSNFNLVHEGFRSVLTMSGTFIISNDINPTTVEFFTGKIDEETNEEEKITLDVITYTDNFTIATDSQPFTNSMEAFNFSQSVGKYGTFSFVIVLFLQDNVFLNKILDVKYIDLDKEPDGVDTEFKFNLIHKNGKGFKNKKFRLISANQSQPLAQHPTITISFTL